MKVTRSLPLIILTLLLLPLLAQRPQTVTINISLDRSQEPPLIRVDREEVEIRPQDRVEWQSSGSADETIEIEFEYQKGSRGPFPARGNSENQSQGRYRKRAGRGIQTQPAKNRGEWKYTVWWITADKQTLQLDPVIIVR